MINLFLLKLTRNQLSNCVDNWDNPDWDAGRWDRTSKILINLLDAQIAMEEGEEIERSQSEDDTGSVIRYRERDESSPFLRRASDK